MNKKILLSLTFGLIFSLIIAFLTYKQFIYPTIIPMVIKGGASLFSDWTVILNANLCLEKGFDVFLENPCDQWKRKHVYGEIILNIPFIRSFPKFFFLYLPILFGFIFLSVVSYILFNISFKKHWPSLLIFIFSVPTILVIERANIDLIVFIFLFIISKNYNLILNYFLIFIASLVKFYPIILTAIFIFYKKMNRIFQHIFLSIAIVSFLLFLQKDSMIKIFENQQQFTGYGFGLYEFSFLGAFKFFNNLNLSFYNEDYSWLTYIYLIFFVIIPAIILNYKTNLKIRNQFTNFNFNNISTFEERLFFLSSTIIVICYFSFSNFIYREIFFLGLIPLILKFVQENNNSFANFFYRILILKFLITTISIYIYQNQLLVFLNAFLIAFKHTIDFYLVSIVLSIYLFLLIKLYKDKFIQVPQKV